MLLGCYKTSCLFVGAFVKKRTFQNKESHYLDELSQILVADNATAEQIGAWEWDLDNNVLFWSKGMISIMGKEPGGPGDQDAPFLGSIAAEDSQIVTRHIKNLLSGKCIENFEFTIVRPDGEIRSLSSHCELVHSCNSKRIFGSVLDITGRNKIAETLQTTFQRLQDIVEFLPDATFVIDRNYKVVAWNRAIEKMTGTPKEEILGKGDYEYAIPFYGKRRPILIDLVGERDLAVKSRYKIIQDGETLRAESFVPTAYSGKGAFLWGIAAPFYDHDGNWAGAIESIRDVTDRRQAEEALQRRTLKLEETNTALKVLLRESSETKEYLEKKMLSNVKKLVTPYINDLEGISSTDQQKRLLSILKENLSQLSSSFSKKISSEYLDLTPREIQIADLIRQGKMNKEIAVLLKISSSAVEFHRRNLRDKLQIKGKKTNLRSYLLTLTG